MADLAEQQRFRRAIHEFLQGGHSGVDEGIVMGFMLVVEMQALDGSRHALLCTSDASGTPLPWYARAGLALVNDEEDEFDEESDEDEDDD